MASLELIPELDVLVVQGGVFLAGMFTIKKLMLDPYIKVKDKRSSLTTGSQEEAKTAITKAKSLSESIAAQVSEAAQKARVERQEIKEVALEKRGRLLESATKEAKAIVSEVTGRIQNEMAEEKEKIPATVATLSAEVYQLAVQ